MWRLFVPADRWVEGRALVEGEAHRHLARVRRAHAGDAVTLFDGQGREVDAVVHAVERDRTVLTLGSPRQAPIASGARIVLLQSLARGERMDLIVQKSTELGVAKIVPVTAERSVARLAATEASARRARWEKIAREAARQCGRADVPLIEPVVPLADAVALSRRDELDDGAGGVGLVLWESARGQSLRAALTAAPRVVVLLVGPEGGFTDDEITAARQADFRLVTLGPRILRVETAAIVAVAITQSATGGLD